MSNKIGFVTMEKVANRKINSVGSSRIRARWVWENWNDAEEYIIGKKYNVLIFQKAWWDDMIYNFKGIKIFDICDPDFFDFRQQGAIRLMQACDAITTSSLELKKYIEKFINNIPIIHVPDRIDFKYHKKVKTNHNDKLKKVVWFGYSSWSKYLERSLDILNEKSIDLTTISDKHIVFNKSYANFEHTNIKYDYKYINDMLIEFDAVLLPKVRTDYRGKFKTNNKAIKSMALGMPVIQVPDDFERLKSKEQREKESIKKMKYVKDEFDIIKSVEQYKQIIENITKQNPKHKNTK